jgi:transcriptional regulator of acetoin/glycerol metabolism
MSEGPELSAEELELPDGWTPRPLAGSGPEGGARQREHAAASSRKGTVSEHRREERERILDALRSCNWNRVKAAEVSGIPRRTFYRRLREYGIQ